METAIKIEHISKKLGKKQIIKDLSFETYTGEVFGFLGPNGAGKTTTIKMAVGMISIDSGSISICGKDITKDFEGAMQNVGAIVENPEMYKYMSGYQNLKLYANMRKNVTKERIDEVVELVGLSNRIQDKVGKYSLGMRQRLGVAQALLHHPKVLILDEPTNGLDPAGIKHLRDVLKDVAHKENVCVIVSSHLMSEMEMLCDRVGILVQGDLLGIKTVEEMIKEADGKLVSYEYKVDSTTQALALLPKEYETKAITDTCFEIMVPTENENSLISSFNRTLIENQIRLYTVAKKDTHNLEDAFIAMTKEGGDQIA